jgi:penicillin-binding protein activator
METTMDGFRFVVLLTAALMAGACARGPSIRYGDPTKVETLTDEYGSTDLQGISERMVQSLVRHPVIMNGDRPVVQVSTVKNKTTEHIDTKTLTDKIRTALLKTGMVRFTAVSDASRELSDTLDYQRSGAVDRKSAKRVGKQVGADYILVGEIDSIVKSDGRRSDVYYKFNLNLVDVESGLIEWADEKEIRKESTRPLVGR